MIENILAIPSKGRMRDESLQLLQDSGVSIDVPERQLTVKTNLPEVGDFTVAFLRPKDIVKLVARDEIPLGIAGLDTIREYDLSKPQGAWSGWRVQSLLQLGIGICRLVIAAPIDSDFKTRQEFEEQGGYRNIPQIFQFDGCTIATSYPTVTKYDILNYYGSSSTDMLTTPKVKFIELAGAVEGATTAGLADAICDLVETGSSLEANGLREIVPVLDSQAVLITNIDNRKGSNKLVDAVRDRIFATLLDKGNPDAIAIQERYEKFLRSYR